MSSLDPKPRTTLTMTFGDFMWVDCLCNNFWVLTLCPKLQRPPLVKKKTANKIVSLIFAVWKAALSSSDSDVHFLSWSIGQLCTGSLHKIGWADQWRNCLLPMRLQTFCPLLQVKRFAWVDRADKRVLCVCKCLRRCESSIARRRERDGYS